MVVEDGDRLLGVAWTSEYRSREAYAGVAEFSAYVARHARGRGVGRLALGQLIGEAERRGFWKLVSRIFPENVATRRPTDDGRASPDASGAVVPYERLRRSTA